jgi:hypothetical protein
MKRGDREERAVAGRTDDPAEETEKAVYRRRRAARPNPRTDRRVEEGSGTVPPGQGERAGHCYAERTRV